MQLAHYVRRPAWFPIALPFFKLDVAPIAQIAHADWLQSLCELVPHLSRLLVSCVFSIIFLVELLTSGSVISKNAQRANILILPCVRSRRLCTYFAELSRSQKTLCLTITGYPTFPVSPLHLAFCILILCQSSFLHLANESFTIRQGCSC